MSSRAGRATRWLCPPCWPCSAEPGEVVRTLDYAHSSLHDVPGEVFTYERTLEELVLDSNRIRDLPRPLFLCQELRVLSISDNDVSALPPAVSTLTALQRLDASRNALRDVPSDIKACKRLASVNLSSNQLVRLPEGLTQLVALQELQLNDVELEFLPASVGRLALLRVMELRDNRLNSLPSSMSRLKQLTRLDIGHNEFRTWPSVLGSLNALSELWADLNELPALPAWVGNLHELQCLDASNNRVSAIAPEIASCVKLVDLRLSYNELSRLPYTLGRLRHLATLKLDHNYLDQLPETIGDASALEELVASHNQLDLVTPCLGFLRRLQLLDLDNNNLSEIPPELGSCRALSVLSLRRNRLVSIPPEIGHLPRIRVINLAENRLRNLPVSILNLSSLQALWLSDIQSAPLVQLHREYDVEQRCRVLTCLLLPQREDQGDEFAGDPNTASSANTGSGAPIARRSACIRFSQDLTLEDEPGVLLRAPTPYPKELRTLARQAKQAARQSAARSCARQAEVSSEVVAPSDADSQPHFVNEQLLSPGLSAGSTVKEARVSRPQDPATLSRTNSVLQQEHCILQEMAVNMSGAELQGYGHERSQTWDQGLELQELYSHNIPENRTDTEALNLCEQGQLNVSQSEQIYGRKMPLSGDQFDSSARIYEVRNEVNEFENPNSVIGNIQRQRSLNQADETYVSRRSVLANSRDEAARKEESSKSSEQIRNRCDDMSASAASAYSSQDVSNNWNSNSVEPRHLSDASAAANKKSSMTDSSKILKQDSNGTLGHDELRIVSPKEDKVSTSFKTESLSNTPLTYSSVYKDGIGRYCTKSEDATIRRYENLSLHESPKSSCNIVAEKDGTDENSNITPSNGASSETVSECNRSSSVPKPCSVDDVDSSFTPNSSNLKPDDPKSPMSYNNEGDGAQKDENKSHRIHLSPAVDLLSQGNVNVNSSCSNNDQMNRSLSRGMPFKHETDVSGTFCCSSVQSQPSYQECDDPQDQCSTQIEEFNSHLNLPSRDLAYRRVDERSQDTNSLAEPNVRENSQSNESRDVDASHKRQEDPCARVEPSLVENVHKINNEVSLLSERHYSSGQAEQVSHHRLSTDEYVQSSDCIFSRPNRTEVDNGCAALIKSDQFIDNSSKPVKNVNLRTTNLRPDFPAIHNSSAKFESIYGRTSVERSPSLLGSSLSNNSNKSHEAKSDSGNNNHFPHSKEELVYGSRRGTVTNMNTHSFGKTDPPIHDVSPLHCSNETSSAPNIRNEDASAVLDRAYEYSRASQPGTLRAVNTVEKLDSVYGTARRGYHVELNASVHGSETDNSKFSPPSAKQEQFPPTLSGQHDLSPGVSSRSSCLVTRSVNNIVSKNVEYPVNQSNNKLPSTNTTDNEKHRSSASTRVDKQHMMPADKGDLLPGGNVMRDQHVTQGGSPNADPVYGSRSYVYGSRLDQQGNAWSGRGGTSTIYGFQPAQENHTSGRDSYSVYGTSMGQRNQTQFYPCCAPTARYGICTPVTTPNLKQNAANAIGDQRFTGPRNGGAAVPESHPFNRPFAGGGVVGPSRVEHTRPVENNYALGRGRPPDPLYCHKPSPPRLPAPAPGPPVGLPPFTLGALYQQREGIASVHEQNKQIQAMLRRGEMPHPAPQPLVVRANVAQCLDDGSPLTAIGPDSQYGQHHVVMRF